MTEEKKGLTSILFFLLTSLEALRRRVSELVSKLAGVQIQLPLRTKHDPMIRKYIPSFVAARNSGGELQRRRQRREQALRAGMGKKSRLTGGAVGRRTILQLSPPGLRGGNAGEREEAPSGSDGNFSETCYLSGLLALG